MERQSRSLQARLCQSAESWYSSMIGQWKYTAGHARWKQMTSDGLTNRYTKKNISQINSCRASTRKWVGQPLQLLDDVYGHLLSLSKMHPSSAQASWGNMESLPGGLTLIRSATPVLIYSFHPHYTPSRYIIRIPQTSMYKLACSPFGVYCTSSEPSLESHSLGPIELWV